MQELYSWMQAEVELKTRIVFFSSTLCMQRLLTQLVHTCWIKQAIKSELSFRPAFSFSSSLRMSLVSSILQANTARACSRPAFAVE